MEQGTELLLHFTFKRIVCSAQDVLPLPRCDLLSPTLPSATFSPTMRLHSPVAETMKAQVLQHHRRKRAAEVINTALNWTFHCSPQNTHTNTMSLILSANIWFYGRDQGQVTEGCQPGRRGHWSPALVRFIANVIAVAGGCSRVVDHNIDTKHEWLCLCTFVIWVKSCFKQTKLTGTLHLISITDFLQDFLGTQ